MQHVRFRIAFGNKHQPYPLSCRIQYQVGNEEETCSNGNSFCSVCKAVGIYLKGDCSMAMGGIIIPIHIQGPNNLHPGGIHGHQSHALLLVGGCPRVSLAHEDGNLAARVRRATCPPLVSTHNVAVSIPTRSSSCGGPLVLLDAFYSGWMLEQGIHTMVTALLVQNRAVSAGGHAWLVTEPVLRLHWGIDEQFLRTRRHRRRSRRRRNVFGTSGNMSCVQRDFNRISLPKIETQPYRCRLTHSLLYSFAAPMLRLK